MKLEQNTTLKKIHCVTTYLAILINNLGMSTAYNLIKVKLLLSSGQSKKGFINNIKTY